MLFVALLSVFLIFMAFVKTHYHPEKYRKEIIAMARDEFGVDVEFGGIDLTLFQPGVTVDGVIIKAGGKPMLYAKRLEAYVSIGSILKGVPSLRKLQITSPLAFATRGTDGTWNFMPVVKKIIETKSVIGVPSKVVVVNGRLIVIDEKAEGGAAVFAFSSVKGVFRKAGWVRPMKVDVEADIYDPIAPGKIKTTFESWVKAPDWEWKGKWMEGKLTLKSVNARRFAAYLSDYVPERYLAKKYSGDMGFSGRLNEQIKFKGEVSAAPLNAPAQTADLRRIKFDGSHQPGKVFLNKLELILPEASVTGNMAVTEYDGDNPKISFRAETTMINIGKLAQFVPPQYKDEPVVKFAETSILDGSFRLTDVRFNGPAKSFVNLKEPENLKMLSGSIEVKNLALKTEGMLRKVEGVGGTLRLTGHDIGFNFINGVYGGSALGNASGTISDLYENPKLVVTVAADLNARELSDELSPKVSSARLREIISPIKSIVGNVDVRLKAEADLKKRELTGLDGSLTMKNVGFRHDNYKATIDSLKGVVDFTKDGIGIKSVSFGINKCQFRVLGNVTGVGTEKYKLDLNVDASGEFARLADTKLIDLDVLKNVGGSASATLKIIGNLDDFEFVQTADISGASIVYKDVVRKEKGASFAENLSGRVYGGDKLKITSGNVAMGKSALTFSGEASGLPSLEKFDVKVDLEKLNLEDLEGYLKLLRREDVKGTLSGNVRLTRGAGKDETALKIKAKIQKINLAWLNNLAPVLPVIEDLKPEGHAEGSFEAVYKNGNIDMDGKITGKGVGFFTPVLPKPLYGLSGEIVLKGNKIRFRRISGRIGNSYSQISGSIIVQKEPVIDYHFTAEKLDLQDVLDFDNLQGGGADDDSSMRSRVKIQINSKSGLIGSLSYVNMTGGFSYFNNKFNIPEFAFTSHNGKFKAGAEIDITGNEPVINTSIEVKGVELASMLEEVWPKLDKVTGKMDVDGKFSGAGMTWAKLRSTLGGHVRFRVEDGLVVKYAGISDILSIVNLVPIFEKRSGRQTGAGLPYEYIAGDMEFKNGVGHTDNTVLEGDVVRMSAVGDLDFGKEKMSLLVGVKPFTTLDKIISNVPIAGKLLTGDEKSLIVSYYEVKGDMGEPVARAVPAESIGRAFFGVIRRLLEPTAKALSDTPKQDGPAKDGRPVDGKK